MVSFDPTWSAGYIDQGQFKTSNTLITRYYQRKPDYLWQFCLIITRFETGTEPVNVF
jgi:hypothetical protein